MNEEILEITKKFHDTYEKLSKEYNYETRKETRVFDINSNNGKLMYATVNEIISPILEENQELKEKLDKYENPEDMTLIMMWCTEKVKDENRELKKQLEEKENIACDWKDSCLENAGKIEILETQQKEFIKYLEEEIKTLEKDILDTVDDMDIYMKQVKSLIIEQILQKYKEIIGEK